MSSSNNKDQRVRTPASLGPGFVSFTKTPSKPRKPKNEEIERQDSKGKVRCCII